jgi:hypothetical protein
MPMIHSQDQYAIVRGDLALCDFAKNLPTHLHYRAPLVGLSIGDWVRSGGFGRLGAPPVRGDILGLEYQIGPEGPTRDGRVRVGGPVLRRASGYDLTRFVIASDSSLERQLRLESLTVRLWPRPDVRRREARIDPAQVTAVLEELRLLGAAFGFTYRRSNGWWARGEWWDARPDWGEPTPDPVVGELTNLEIRDAFGVFPRPGRAVSALELRLLSAL